MKRECTLLQRATPLNIALHVAPFAHTQERIAERKHIPNYERLLMECEVARDTEGIVFNTKHPSWKHLSELARRSDGRRVS